MYSSERNLNNQYNMYLISQLFLLYNLLAKYTGQVTITFKHCVGSYKSMGSFCYNLIALIRGPSLYYLPYVFSVFCLHVYSYFGYYKNTIFRLLWTQHFTSFIHFHSVFGYNYTSTHWLFKLNIFVSLA